jgi:hypothetical protein
LRLYIGLEFIIKAEDGVEKNGEEDRKLQNPNSKKNPPHGTDDTALDWQITGGLR